MEMTSAVTACLNSLERLCPCLQAGRLHYVNSEDAHSMDTFSSVCMRQNLNQLLDKQPENLSTSTIALIVLSWPPNVIMGFAYEYTYQLGYNQDYQC